MHFQHQVVIGLIIPRNADFWAKKTWEIKEFQSRQNFAEIFTH